MSNFWDLIWIVVSAFIFVAYLLVLFQVLTDLFRDREMGGVAKAVWIIALIFAPFLTALVYVIARGRGMADRQNAAAQNARTATEDYIRQAAGRKSPTEQISEAKALLDGGAINPAEFARLKDLALR